MLFRENEENAQVPRAPAQSLLEVRTAEGLYQEIRALQNLFPRNGFAG